MSVVLLIGVLKEASGNNSTLRRIQKYFKTCLIEDCSSFRDEGDLESFIYHHHVTCILALHAFHAGKLLSKDCSVPFGIILGGTDINTFSHHPQCNHVMKKALMHATCIVSFSEWLKMACIHLWPELKTKKFFEISQAVNTGHNGELPLTTPSSCLSHNPHLPHNDPSTHNGNETITNTSTYIKDLTNDSSENLCNNFKNHPTTTTTTNHLVNIPTSTNLTPPPTIATPLSTHPLIFTMVTGLRREKDPLYLLHSFQRWSERCSFNVLLLIIGAQTNKDYGKVFLERVKKYPSVRYVGSMPKWQVDELVGRSVAVVNSSLSEGMCQSILEAMQQGVAVVARDIPGNRDLITHQQNGLLYTTPQEFIDQAESLLMVDGLRERLVDGGRKRVVERHSEEMEKNKYRAVLRFMEGSMEE